MGRLSRGWELTKMSFSVIRQDKEILIFPLISGVISILVFASFVGAWFFAFGFSFDNQNVLFYVILFAFYLITSFIVVFFNVAIVACATKRMEGGDPTISYGLSFAASRVKYILMWSLIAATVGLIIRAIRERAGPLGGLIGALGGLAWAIATYFVVPVLAFEQVGPWEALKRSASILKRTWGEALVSNLGVGLIFFLLGLIGFLGLFAAIFLIAATQSIVLFIVVLAIVVVYWIVLALVSSAVNAVLMAALYRYATTGKISKEFPEEAIRNPFSIG